MIDRVTGVLLAVDDAGMVVEVGGIGLMLRMADPRKVAARPGTRVTLMVSVVVSRDRIDLYGFRSAEERDRFRELTAIPGVGGVTALKLLPHVEAVRAGRFDELPAVPGIGPAKRARLSRWLRRQAAGRSGPVVPRESELREALEALGVEVAQARLLAHKAVTARPDAAVEELLRTAVAGAFDGEGAGRKGRKG